VARPLRVQFPGAIYHVTARLVGSWRDERLRLFRDDRDYGRFLEKLGRAVEEAEVRLYLFCLMGNHFHLVLETPKGNLSRMMQKVSTAYSVYFNRRHQRHGHLLDGRYKAKVVEGDDYLLRLSRYVHLNPVHTGGWKARPLPERLEHLRGYRWSSYLDYVGSGKERRWPFLDQGPVLAQVGGRGRDRRERYREFVESGLAEDDAEMREMMSESPLGIGGEAFQQSLWGLHQRMAAERQTVEDVSYRRVAKGLEAEAVLQTVADVLGVEVTSFGQRQRGSPLRAVAVRFLLRDSGLTQREIADLLGMGTGAAVCLQAKRYDIWLGQDRRLSRKAAEIERRLDAMKAERRV
jgi:putative transposase